MDRRTRIFAGKFCVECKRMIIERPDRLPLCSDCERILTEKAAAHLPKLARKGKLELVSDAVIKE